MDYDRLDQTIDALCHGERDTVALMATVACELHHAHPLSDWTGFYRVTEPEVLKIGPYQGSHGCLVIPFGRGVCGAAARTGEIQLVPDVEAFPDHIACSSSTRSEIVLPVRNGEGRLLGVLDLDSNTPAAFTEEDARSVPLGGFRGMAEPDAPAGHSETNLLNRLCPPSFVLS
ncbi:GAF domain-containing protein [Cereibacter azotoformans]|uniref:GAF domain-containing protein n=1 Tax=Cereibacter azotoformans TaxID=43057 RepID=UPI001F206DD3|nr:GAF domain-containing protein [Cereibacter azotoformans]